MYDLTKCCYMCLKQDSYLKPVFNGDQNNASINNKLKYIIPELVLLHPEHPVLICNTCFVSVTSFYEFKTKCLTVNHYIRTILHRSQKTNNDQISQNKPPPCYTPQLNVERNVRTFRPQTTIETRNQLRGQDTNLDNLANENRQHIPPTPVYHKHHSNEKRNVYTLRTETTDTFRSQDTSMLHENRQDILPPPAYKEPQLNYERNVQTSRLSTTEARNTFGTYGTTLVNENRQTQKNTTIENDDYHEVSASNNKLYQENLNKLNHTPWENNYSVPVPRNGIQNTSLISSIQTGSRNNFRPDTQNTQNCKTQFTNSEEVDSTNSRINQSTTKPNNELQKIQYYEFKKFFTNPQPDPEEQIIHSVPTNNLKLPLQLNRHGKPIFGEENPIDIKDHFYSYSNKDVRKFYQELLDMSNTSITQDFDKSTKIQNSSEVKYGEKPKHTQVEVENASNQQTKTKTQPETEQPCVKEDIDVKENFVPFLNNTDRQVYTDILNINSKINQTELSTIKSEPVDPSENSDEWKRSTCMSNQMAQNAELTTDSTVLPPTNIKTQNVTSDDTDIKEEMPNYTEIDKKYYQDLQNESDTVPATSESVVTSLESESPGEITTDGLETTDHSGTSAGDELVKCEVCDIELPKRIMYFHMQIHGGVACTICKKQYRNNSNLDRHMKEQHGIKSDYECSICKKHFVFEKTYKTHLKFHSDELPHECLICHKKFLFKSGYKGHMYSHAEEEDKKEECPQCGKKFLNKAHLKVHLVTHVGKNTNLDCEVCGKHFVRAENLIQHKLIHTGLKKHECAICNRKFLHKWHLKQHMPTHGGDREFKCPECDKSFNYNCSLQKHIEVHEKNKSKRREK